MLLLNKIIAEQRAVETQRAEEQAEQERKQQQLKALIRERRDTVIEALRLLTRDIQVCDIGCGSEIYQIEGAGTVEVEVLGARFRKRDHFEMLRTFVIDFTVEDSPAKLLQEIIETLGADRAEDLINQNTPNL